MLGLLDLVPSFAKERRGDDSLKIMSLIDFLGLEGVLFACIGWLAVEVLARKERWRDHGLNPVFPSSAFSLLGLV